MGCDMLVALSRATVDGSTLFGHNCNRPGGEDVHLLRQPGRNFSPGEQVRIGDVTLPQARRTWTVLAGSCPRQWGYLHGINEHGVTVGLTTIHTKRDEPATGLTGADLVRLTLERAASARQAVDLATDLASRHGQHSGTAEDDSGFLLADGREAYVVEMFGRHWAVQRIGVVRAVSDVCHLRQDWDSLSHGLADLAIARNWWPADGSKLDFAGAVGSEGGDNAASLRRWARATLLLEQQSGAIDMPFVRHVLSDHFDNDMGDLALCRHTTTPAALGTAASLITQVDADAALPIAWYSFGPPCRSVYFPFLLVGEWPAQLHSTREEALQVGERLRRRRLDDEGRRAGLESALTGLQERFDQETRDFAAEAADLRARGQADHLPRLAELFMRHTLECWENLCQEFAPKSIRHTPVSRDSPSAEAWS